MIVNLLLPVRVLGNPARGLGRTIELPFVPFPGLVLVNGEWEFTIQDVLYDLQNEELNANLEDNLYGDSEEANEAIAELLRMGWKEEA